MGFGRPRFPGAVYELDALWRGVDASVKQSNRQRAARGCTQCQSKGQPRC